ncbi:hypothetical protein FACS1894190_14120 [Spirochaetia bacterium]|nr:hypothetical protein FACS1894190_14120 [Spirochaetia bacterium]
MKKTILLKSSLVLLLVSLIIGCSLGNSELFKETDAFVESLFTTYESYGALGGAKYAKTTNDGLYTVMPIGRLINVKIQKVVDDEVYEKLRKSLERHYKNDKRVNQVYINQGGTIMIDCRN